jgi:hypothetical protein
VSYAHTNSPSGIFRALPSYSETSNGSQSIGRDGGGDEEDSYSAKEAMLIEHSKDCWSILRPGFIQRKQLSIDSPKDKGNKRTRDVFEEEYSEEQSGEFPTIVAEHAWPVLDWFLNIFEQDEVLTEDQKTSE